MIYKMKHTHCTFRISQHWKGYITRSSYFLWRWFISAQSNNLNNLRSVDRRTQTVLKHNNLIMQYNPIMASYCISLHKIPKTISNNMFGTKESHKIKGVPNIQTNKASAPRVFHYSIKQKDHQTVFFATGTLRKVLVTEPSGLAKILQVFMSLSQGKLKHIQSQQKWNFSLNTVTGIAWSTFTWQNSVKMEQINTIGNSLGNLHLI